VAPETHAQIRPHLRTVTRQGMRWRHPRERSPAAPGG
jgi:hypothetical protein